MADPSRIVGLEADRRLVCTGTAVEITATVEPAGGNLTWSGDLGSAATPSPPTLPSFFTHFAPGTNTVTATADTNSMSITIRAGRIVLEIAGGTNQALTATPEMPDIEASVVVEGGVPTGPITWTVRVISGGFDFEGCPGAPTPFGEELSETFHGTGPHISIDLPDRIVGGGVFFEASTTIGDTTCRAIRGLRIGGTNPARLDIRHALSHDTLRRIACKESGQRQFDAPPDGGTGRCPLFGCGGRVGVLQIPDPTLDEAWNWAANVAKGTQNFAATTTEAESYPERVRTSSGFQDLVDEFNTHRGTQGLPSLDVRVPDFTTGNFDDDLRQLELDTIRGYNGWFGVDRFGLELHEFRVAVDSINGTELLRVVDVDEATRTGQAVWERVPVEDRPTDGECNEPDYVDEVLSLRPDCAADDPQPDACGATLRVLDFQNNRIDPATQALSVSNHVSDDAALGPVDVAFGAFATDRNAFRFEVEDPGAVGPFFDGTFVEVELAVGGRRPRIFRLARTLANRYRGPFLRLVTDGPDAAALDTSQNILCTLGDTLEVRYQNAPDCLDMEVLRVGRPTSESNNAHPNHLEHDIRELKLNVVVFSRRGNTHLDGAIDATQTRIKVDSVAEAHLAGTLKIGAEIISYADIDTATAEFVDCVRGLEGTTAAAHPDRATALFAMRSPAASLEEVSADLHTVDERFAQCGVKLRPVDIDFGGVAGEPPTPTGKVLPAALLDRFQATEVTLGSAPGQRQPTAAERAVAALKDGDPNSIDVFYVDSRIYVRPPPDERHFLAALARPASFNSTGDTTLQNFIVMGTTERHRDSPLVLAHEVLHILLNRGHRTGGEPSTSLFRGRLSDKSGSTKRIGPYPDAESAGVGFDDTQTVRAHAESLPT